MSDRIAVFNEGRIEQVGSAAEVYERPATQFVAGFVGTSNMLSGEAARSILGQDGTFSVRPEKIRLAEPGDAPRAGEDSALGTVREVVYVGSATRYVVDLDAGGRLVAMAQNSATTSMDVHGRRGQAVRLIWAKQHEYRVD